MIDHISIAVRDLAKGERFYAAALATLGFAKLKEVPGAAIGFGSGRHVGSLCRADEERSGGAVRQRQLRADREMSGDWTVAPGRRVRSLARHLHHHTREPAATLVPRRIERTAGSPSDTPTSAPAEPDQYCGRFR
jgi:catechol 2,3-dioxygenase-like lactoylglutathione lyase family enzyme